MKNTKDKTRRVALTGMLFALAIVLSLLEGTLTPLLGLPPGVKPGLANIVVMFALMFIDTPSALALVILKAFFVTLTRGASAGLLSLAGGLLSLIIMVALAKLKQPSLFITSVSGAIAHNFGQLAALSFIFTQSGYTLYYALVLLISGLVMGTVTSLILKCVIPALKKLKINRNNYQ